LLGLQFFGVFLRFFFNLFNVFGELFNSVFDGFKLVFLVGLGFNKLNSGVVGSEGVLGNFLLNLGFTTWDFSD
jgi:hypothetical protein